MNRNKVKYISDIKSLEELNRLKLQKKYQKDLKKLEFEVSLNKLQENISPEKIKETLFEESQNYFQDLTVKYLPSFLLKLIKK